MQRIKEEARRAKAIELANMKKLAGLEKESRLFYRYNRIKASILSYIYSSTNYVICLFVLFVGPLHYCITISRLLCFQFCKTF